MTATPNDRPQAGADEITVTEDMTRAGAKILMSYVDMYLGGLELMIVNEIYCAMAQADA
ncbi:MAG: hypothetical protein NVS1B6_06350 [Steroidobacteraceae bacterium]